jgi:hypothetical protein
MIANVPGRTSVRQWTKYPEQKSALITLQAGQAYYLEALHKEGTSNDHLAVSWLIPGKTQEIIAGQYLSPFAVQPVSNIAVGKAARQSSTANGGVASRAVDGNTSGNWTDLSVTQTISETKPWWQVDLGQSYAIDSLQLWNRTDCCAARLSNFYVFVSSTDLTGRTLSDLLNDSTIWRSYRSGQVAGRLYITAGLQGRYVRVQLAGSNRLSLAEVQVFATP